MSKKSPNGSLDLKARVDELEMMYDTAKSHPRSKTRRLALKAIIVGSLINFICFIMAFTDYDDAPKHVTGWTSVAVGLH